MYGSSSNEWVINQAQDHSQWNLPPLPFFFVSFLFIYLKDFVQPMRAYAGGKRKDGLAIAYNKARKTISDEAG